MAGEFIRIDAKVEIFPDRVDKLLNTPNGPVGQMVKSAAERVLQAAPQFIGTEYSGTTGKPKEPRSSHLKDAGSVQPSQGSSWSVVFDHPAARVHHQGAAEHPIGSNEKVLGNSLYPNTRDGHPRYPNRLFYAVGEVTHPGHDPNPYLIKAAEQVGLRASGALRRGPTDTNPIFRTTTLG